MNSSLSRRAIIRSAMAVGCAAVASDSVLGAAQRSAEGRGISVTALDASSDLGSPTFYVSASGQDGADGLSPQTAWATIQKATSALPSNGAKVLFERGGTFYGELVLPAGCEVGAYGDGPRPVLTLYKLLNRPDGWVRHAAGVWRIDLGNPLGHWGYTATKDANIGFLVVDGQVKPALKFALSDLDEPWDFYCDVPAHTLYVRVDANPTTLASDVRAAPNGIAPVGTGAVIYCNAGNNDIHDVHVTGSGGCGIWGDASDVRVHDCVIDYVGGAWLEGHGNGTSRYGNGIALWVNVSRWSITENEIAHVYDAAWSPQGMSQNGGPVFWQDLTVTGNHIHDCGQSMEIFSESDNPASPGFVRIRFEDNVCERAGYGAFENVRANPDVRVHLLSYNLQTPVDVTIANNVFADSRGAYSYHSTEPPPGFVTRDNAISLRAGHRLEFQRDQTVEQAAAWQAATGRERNSIITVIR